MKFAVIGARSFSGRAFCAHLLTQGLEPLELSRPRYDLNVSLDAMLERIEAVRATHIVNFAALNMVAESWAHDADYYRTNVIGVAKLADAMRQMPFVERFVQVSTPEVYGATEQLLAESTPFRPSTPYAVSRAAADMHLRALHATFDFPVLFTRTVNVYGPGQQPYRIIPKTVLSVLRGRNLELHGGGQSTRSFIHIDDVAEAIYAVATRGVPGETYHAATRLQTSIRWLVARICELMGADFNTVVKEAPERPGKDPAYQLDDRKIRVELGWRDRIGLDDGLPKTVAWFREHAAEYQSLEYAHRA